METGFPILPWPGRDALCFVGLAAANLVAVCFFTRSQLGKTKPRDSRALAISACAVAMFLSFRGFRGDYAPGTYSGYGITLQLNAVRTIVMLLTFGSIIVWFATVFGLIKAHKQLTENGEGSFFWPSLGPLCVTAGLAIVSLLPTLGNHHEAFDRAACRTNLKQVGTAIHLYHEDRAVFPLSSTGDPSVSWRVSLLPYLEHDEIFKRYDTNVAWSHSVNLTVAQEIIPEYACPSVSRYDRHLDKQRRAFTAFAMLTGQTTAFPRGAGTTLADIKDGASNTLMVVEACGQNIVWTEPRDSSIDAMPLGINLRGKSTNDSPGITSSYHHNGCNVLFADGSVRFINENVTPKILNSMATTDGGEKFVAP
jgi:prepilin-type processing-associated H-X9-DG protein